MKPPVFDLHHDASAMRAALVATTSALNFMSQNSSAKVPRKLRLTPFKIADEKIGDIRARHISRYHCEWGHDRGLLSLHLGNGTSLPLNGRVRCKLIHKIQKTSWIGQLQGSNTKCIVPIFTSPRTSLPSWEDSKAYHAQSLAMLSRLTSTMVLSIYLQEIKINSLVDRYGEKSLA